jgi:hypothetical protein
MDTNTHAGQLPAMLPDTVRAARQAVQLAEVRIKPAATLTLSSLAPKASRANGYCLVPGGTYATLLSPEPGSGPLLLEKLEVRLHPGQPTEGRLRVRLVNAVSGPTPGTVDLLPNAPLYSAAQLAALPKGLLTLDVSAAALLLPPEGIFVLLEGLPTSTAEQCLPMRRDDPTPWLLLTATDPQNPATHRRTPADQFPAVSLGSSRAAPATFVRQCHHTEWLFHPADSKGRSENLDIRLTLRPQ